MPRGERIGDAYIRIHADGSGFDKEIRREWDPVIRSAGKEHGKTYSKAFNDELERRGKVNLISFAGEINKALGRFDAGQQFVENFTVALDDLRDRVGREHGPEIGQRLAEEIRQSMLRGAIQTREEFLDTISDLTPAITRITNDIDREHDSLIEKMKAAQEQFLRDSERAEAESSAERLQLRRAEAASIIASIQNRAREEEADARRQRARLVQARGDFDKLREAVERYARGVTEAGGDQDSLLTRLHEVREEMRQTGVATSDTDRELKKFRRTIRTAIPDLDRARHSLLGVSDGVGRLFGRGSRNDFINFIGSAVRGLARFAVLATTGLVRFVTNMARGLKQMADGMSAMAQAASTEGFKAALSVFGSGFSLVATTAGTAGLNLIAMAAALGALAAGAVAATVVLSGLLAILTSLVATISFAAASALPALVAGFLPLVAGIGVATAAYKSLSEAQKEALQEDLKPLTNAFKDLGDAAADVLFQDVGKWARGLAPLLRRAEAGVVGIAKAIRETLDDAITSMATSPQFEHFIDRMNVFLPNAVRKLGDIFTNVFEGMGGVILAMLPSINRFLRWLGDITEEFSNWANSREGRAELREFFRDAGDSAAALGDFLKQAVKFLAQLLAQTREGGDEMFRKMADGVREMVEWLTSPQGRQAIADWVEFGKDFLDAIGKVVVAVAAVIDTLDNPTTRTVMTFIVEQTANWFNLINLILGGYGEVLGLVRDIVSAIKDIDLPDGWSGFAAGIGGAFGSDSQGKIVASGKALGSWEDAARGAASASRLTSEDMESLAGTLNQITGAATEATRALALQQLQEQGLLQVGRQVGLSARTLVAAFTGQKGAVQQVTDAYNNLGRNASPELRAQLEGLITAMGGSIDSLKRQRRDILLNSQTVTRYGKTLNTLPEKVRTLIRTDGIRPSVQGFAQVIKKAKELAPNLNRRDIKTIISATGVPATEKLIARVMKAVKRLDKAEGKPTIKPDVRDFDRGLANVDRRLDTTDKKETKPKADLDLRPFNTREAEVKRALTSLGKQVAKPKADLDITPFLSARAAVVNSLNTIPDEHVTIFVHRKDAGGGGGGESSGGGGGEESGRTTGRQINLPAINVYSNADPKAIAVETLNRIAAQGY